jgi:hypothetical protein
MVASVASSDKTCDSWRQDPIRTTPSLFRRRGRWPRSLAFFFVCCALPKSAEASFVQRAPKPVEALSWRRRCESGRTTQIRRFPTTPFRWDLSLRAICPVCRPHFKGPATSEEEPQGAGIVSESTIHPRSPSTTSSSPNASSNCRYRVIVRCDGRPRSTSQIPVSGQQSSGRIGKTLGGWPRVVCGCGFAAELSLLTLGSAQAGANDRERKGKQKVNYPPYAWPEHAMFRTRSLPRS